MASVWYVGPQTQRVITDTDWSGAGIVAPTVFWSKHNGWSIPQSQFTAPQLAILDADEGFWLGQADGPRPGATVVSQPTRPVTHAELAEALANLGPGGGLPEYLEQEALAETYAPVGDYAEAAEVVASNRIADMLNSWHAYPDFVMDMVRKRGYITGATRGGAVKIGWFDTLSNTSGSKTISMERHAADDHYTRSIMLREGKQPWIVGAYHDRDASLRTIRGLSYGEFDMLAPEIVTNPVGVTALAYGQIIGPNPQNVDNGFACMYRGNGENMLSRTTDGANTWPDGPHRLHTKGYSMHRRNGNIGHFLAFDHPTAAVPQIRYFKYALASGGGSPKTAAGAGILTAGVTGTDIWTHTPPDFATSIVNTASTDLVRAAPTGQSQRCFDMSRNARYVAIGTYADKNTLDVGCSYKVLARQTSDTTNTWAMEDVSVSGPSFGPSGYVGGACFAADGSLLLINNRAGGAKTLERWVRTGADFGAGTWALDRVLYTAPAGVVALGRPRVPLNCDDSNAIVPGWVTFGEYHYYDPTSFLNFYGDQVLIPF